MGDLKLHGHSLSDDELILCYDAFIRNDKNKTKAAEELGMPRKTFSDRIKSAYARNIDQRYEDAVVAPGTEIVEEKSRIDGEGNLLFATVRTKPQAPGEFEMPPKWAIEKSTVQVDGHGNLIQQWARIKPEWNELLSIHEAIELATSELVGDNGATPRPTPPVNLMEDLLTLRILPDLHLGQYSWGKETGVAWDLPTAIARFKDVMTIIDSITPPSDTCVVLGGGDMLHADNKHNQTDRSRNPLDVDSRFSKVKAEAMKLLVFQIDMAREKHNEVIVRVLPGNHDEIFADSAAWFLHAWYRDCPEVKIDTDPSDWWFFEWGDVMIGANHGHKVKWTEIPRIMSTYQRELWGRTRFAYAHGFHIHHHNKLGWEEGGVKGETHQAATAPDAFHHGGGYADSGISMPMINYHKQKGEQGRWTEPVF